MRLYSDPGELILDPFTGIGTVGYLAIKHGRRFIGSELKKSYADEAIANMKGAAKQKTRQTSMALPFKEDETDPEGPDFFGVPDPVEVESIPFPDDPDLFPDEPEEGV